MQMPPHFTNIQHGLQLARKFLCVQDTPNRQVVLITDGLPTAHFEGKRAVPALSAGPAHRGGDAARRAALCPRRDHDQHLPAAELEPDARRTCASRIGWRNRRAAGSSSRRAASWTAMSCGTTSPAASRSFHSCGGKFLTCQLRAFGKRVAGVSAASPQADKQGRAGRLRRRASLLLASRCGLAGLLPFILSERS